MRVLAIVDQGLHDLGVGTAYRPFRGAGTRVSQRCEQAVKLARLLGSYLSEQSKTVLGLQPPIDFWCRPNGRRTRHDGADQAEAYQFQQFHRHSPAALTGNDL